MLTPLEVHSKQFKARFGRYSAAEVDEFLDQVGQSYDQLWRENAELRERLRQLMEKEQSGTDLGETLKQTLLLAQKAAEEARRNAEEKARLILESAEQQAARSCARPTRLGRRSSGLGTCWLTRPRCGRA